MGLCRNYFDGDHGKYQTRGLRRVQRVKQFSNLNLSPMEQVQGFYPFLTILLLSGHGLRKKSLSPSGALTAVVVGSLMLSGGVRAFGLALIALYLAGSRATKCEYCGRFF
jgi:hypothetical protein